MLRLRLYKGMIPLAGLLIALSLFSVYSQNVLTRRISDSLTKDYSAISRIEQIIFASLQIERALNLKSTEDTERADNLYVENLSILIAWIANDTVQLENERSFLSPKVEAFAAAAEKAFENSSSKQLRELDNLRQALEIAAINSISNRNDLIMDTNKRLQKQTRIHYYVIVGGIAASILLMAGTSYLLSNRILHPIDRLTEFTKKLAKDDWKTEYTPSSNDELADLENAFVDMAQRIREFKKTTDRKIFRTRKRMEECFSNFPHPVLFFNTDRTIVYRNPTGDALVKNLNWKQALPETIARRIESVFGTGKEIHATDFEETIAFKMEAEEQYFLPVVVRIDSDNASEIECALILQDVTNLRLSDELKSDLVATLSHEIKTPVTSATMALHLLLEKGIGDLNEDQEDMAQTAVAELKRLQRLLDHMLQIAKLEHKAPDLKTVAYSPSQIIQSAIEFHSHLADSKGVTLNAQAEADLPDVLIDPKLIEVALSNFISNAIKYGDYGSNVEIYTRANPDGTIRFGVIDEGPGIPEEDTDKIFDKFYRSKITDAKEGIGLGLSICKDIITAHHGHVGCANQKTKGVDIFFSLPPYSNSQA